VQQHLRALQVVALALCIGTTGLVAARQDTTRKPAEPGLRLSRTYAIAPADLRVIVKVAPHAENRLLVVTLDSGDYFRSSSITLDGDHAAVHHPFSWKALPAGDYELRAEVIDARGLRHVATRGIRVVG
jgi:hypothetical protein